MTVVVFDDFLWRCLTRCGWYFLEHYWRHGQQQGRLEAARTRERHTGVWWVQNMVDPWCIYANL
jgi:hypothetical protein